MQLLSDSEQYSIANQMLVLLLLHHQFNKYHPGGDYEVLTMKYWPIEAEEKEEKKKLEALGLESQHHPHQLSRHGYQAMELLQYGEV